MLRSIGFIALGVSLSFAGSVVWSLLFRLNLRALPALPWSALIMCGVIGLCHRLLWRRLPLVGLLPARPRSPWPWLGSVLTAISAVSAVIVGLRFAHLADDAFASTIHMADLPMSARITRVVMASVVAAFFEELGFRGLIQGQLEERYGARPAIGLTALLFYCLHLGHGWTHGGIVTVLAIAVPFLFCSVLWGALTAFTGSLVPSMVAHALTDMALLPLQWTGRHRLDPVAQAGVDIHLAGWALLLVISGAASAFALSKLASTQKHLRRQFRATRATRRP